MLLMRLSDAGFELHHISLYLLNLIITYRKIILRLLRLLRRRLKFVSSTFRIPRAFPDINVTCPRELNLSFPCPHISLSFGSDLVKNAGAWFHTW